MPSRQPTKRRVDPRNRVGWAFRRCSRFWVDDNPRSRENVMRRALEALLKQPCPKQRPLFLNNPATNRCLELDAYCAALKIGCEFQGIQHAQWPNPVHATRAEFAIQVARDALKQTLCEKEGVTLIQVPHTVSSTAISAFLCNELRRHGKLLEQVASNEPDQRSLISVAAVTTCDTVTVPDDHLPSESVSGSESVTEGEAQNARSVDG